MAAMGGGAPDDGFKGLDERLRLALASGGIGIWDWDIAGGRLAWSPTLEAMHGLAAGSFPGTLDASQRDIHPEDKARVLAAIHESIANRQDHALEYRIILPDGSVRWVEARAKLVLDRDGRPLGMTGLCSDITERKSTELAQARLLEEARRTGEFRERILGLVAHDLRSPLNAISILAQCLATSENAPADSLEAAGRIAQSSVRMSRMIDDLLDFTRERLGESLPLYVEEIDMGDVGRTIVEELRLVTPAREIVYETSGALRGRWDAKRVAQVFAHLIGSRLRHGEGPVSVRLQRQSGDVTLEVGSRGQSLPPEMLHTLFEPYGRADPATDGTRLGLYIVRAIVRAHGGSIDLSSAEDGTRFLVRWPTSQ